MEYALLPVMVVVMYLVMIRPQQQKQKATVAMLASLEEGDEIILNSGIHGFLTATDGQVAWVEVAPGLDLKVSRSAIAGVVAGSDDSDAGTAESKKSQSKKDGKNA